MIIFVRTRMGRSNVGAGKDLGCRQIRSLVKVSSISTVYIMVYGSNKILQTVWVLITKFGRTVCIHLQVKIIIVVYQQKSYEYHKDPTSDDLSYINQDKNIN